MEPEFSVPQWGIAIRDALWPVTVRILLVIDGRINLTSNKMEFGLGYVLDTLRAPSSWWISINVHVATREQTITAAELGTNTVQYQNFRFTDGEFNIDNYDQVWFFGDQPSQDDGSDATTDLHIVPPYTLDDAEAQIVAAWMDRGGGVFATGDHGVLGASLCSRIPRVRTMRRWKRSDGVPSIQGPRRHQTLQGGSTYTGEDDTQLQPVELVYWASAHSWPFFPQYRPHPVMCSPWGPIDRFPDHMHEGELVPDDLVVLNRPLDIPGHEAPEYPDAIPEVLALGIGDASQAQWRPTPQIVAFGQTTNSFYPTELAFRVSGAVVTQPALLSKRFGLVSVYDGHPANVGRVVCDSTWHHWFSWNLFGIANSQDLAYRKMQAYYRNVALWLASQQQRRSILTAGVWGALIGSGPGFFNADQDAWEMGERALSVLANTMGPCGIDEVVAAFLDVRTRSLRYLPGDVTFAPRWGALSTDLVNRAVVGGMCQSLLDLAREYRTPSRAYDGGQIDVERIQAVGERGATQGRELLRGSLDDAAASFAALRDAIATIGPSTE
jgi:hypothetical protein